MSERMQRLERNAKGDLQHPSGKPLEGLIAERIAGPEAVLIAMPDPPEDLKLYDRHVGPDSEAEYSAVLEFVRQNRLRERATHYVMTTSKVTDNFRRGVINPKLLIRGPRSMDPANLREYVTRLAVLEVYETRPTS